MENVFIKTKKHAEFSWENLGNITEGRADLGEDVTVLMYRLMQYTMLDVLSKAMGEEQANECFRQAGNLAGREFAHHKLELTVSFDVFLADLQKALLEYKVGILRMEEFDAQSGGIMLTVEQDVDCSGIPVTNETVCYYDEGFIAGILQAYTGKEYDVRETDCWANGMRMCRFKGTTKGG